MPFGSTASLSVSWKRRSTWLLNEYVFITASWYAGGVRYSAQPCSAQIFTICSNFARFFLFVSTSLVTGRPNRKMNARFQYVVGKLKPTAFSGRSSCFAASANTRLASKIASPERGMIGENHMWPAPGFGFVSVRAPIENIVRLGMPNSGSVALREPAAWPRVMSSISAVESGNLNISPFSNVAPGIAENFSWQYSQFAWIVLTGPKNLTVQLQ